jgi:mannose-1-phosphate guanylyltransferase
MYILEQEVLDRIAGGRAVSFEREVFPALVGEGLHALPLQGYWMDIGTPERYLRATRDILHGTVETAVSPSNGAEAAVPPVLIAPGCDISPDARVGPETTVGAGARVEAGASVTGSSLHEGVVAGEGAVVTDSIVGSGAEVGAGARLEAETVIGAGVVVPPGTHLTGGRMPADG